jgi:hypothetical protein
MEKKMGHDGVEFDVCMSPEVSVRITNWAKPKSKSPKFKTYLTLEQLGMNSSITEDEFQDYMTEIKFYISEGFLVNETETLAESTLSVNEREKSAREKQVAYSRTLTKIKINKKYNMLLKAFFPESKRAKSEKKKGNDEAIPSIKDELIPSIKDEATTDDTHDDVESLTNLSMLSI